MSIPGGVTPQPNRAPQIPDRLTGLSTLAGNLFWSWYRAARILFRVIDEPLWRATRHNPIEFLARVDPARLDACARDPEILEMYERVMAAYRRGTDASNTWFAELAGVPLPGGPVAYFCAEFALHNSVPTYSGGLGVLAGDHCKGASDLGVPLVGVGLLYTRGYFDQRIRLDGWQEDVSETFDLSRTPLARVLGPDGAVALASLPISGRTVHVGAYRMLVGRAQVYLLDTDFDANHPDDRELSHKLYPGGAELRLRQEAVLGIGGVRVLRALGIAPAVWHANEGHATFMMLERVREHLVEGVSWNEAVGRVRTSSLFTTHTPVAAGHDIFPPELFAGVMSEYLESFGEERDGAGRLGRHPQHDHHAFHMTAAAIRLSARVTGVSKAHGDVTRNMWRCLWPGREAADVPIVHITNGVHLGTWMSHRLRVLLDSHLGPDWEERAEIYELWDRVLSLDDEELWAVHVRMKDLLLRYIHEEARVRWRDRWEESAHLVGAGTLLDAGTMTIGFARRFAQYKRANLIFRDPERLRTLLINPRRPVQLVFAGKAHPADEGGKQILQQVYSFTRDRRFEGRIAFLEDYELHMAHRLVQGVDLWLNIPRPPMEASGTSGMKAALNGIPQLSTRDGWWAEGYTGLNGWVIEPADEADPDEADAAQLYDLLEHEVVPLYYERDVRNVPREWVVRMKHAMRDAGRFTARRMVAEYAGDLYLPAMRGAWSDDDPPTG